MEHLDFLALNHNEVKSLGAGHFDGLAGLRSLELDYNKISRMDPAAFR